MRGWSRAALGQARESIASLPQDSCIQNFMETAGEDRGDIAVVFGDSAGARDWFATRSSWDTATAAGGHLRQCGSPLRKGTALPR